MEHVLNWKKYEGNVIESKIYTKLRPGTYSAFLRKNTFIEYFFKNRPYWGYKIRLAGRFTRKTGKTIYWIKKGIVPITAHSHGIEYGYSQAIGPYSTFSVRVWINRNKDFKHRYTLKL